MSYPHRKQPLIKCCYDKKYFEFKYTLSEICVEYINDFQVNYMFT